MARFFGPEQTALMTAVVDRLIPREGDHPSASEVGAVEFIDAAVSESATLPRLFSAGMNRIEIESLRGGGARFVDLRDELQDQVLQTVETGSGSEFFEALVGQAYNAYYTNPAAVSALGVDPRPPQPAGHEVDAGEREMRLLDNVIARGRVYREAE